MKTINTRLSRLLAAALAVLLLLGALPMAALAADSSENITSEDDLVTAVSQAGGNKKIKLGGNITLKKPLCTWGDVEIDLNGHTISAEFSSESDKVSVVYTAAGESEDVQSTILATFIVSASSSLTLTGQGTVSAPKVSNAGNSTVYGLFVMSTGKLTVKDSVKITDGGNTAHLVCLNLESELTLQGNVEISGGATGLETTNVLADQCPTSGNANKPSTIKIEPADKITVSSGSAINMNSGNQFSFAQMLDENTYQVEADGKWINPETMPQSGVKSYVFRHRQPPAAPVNPVLSDKFAASWSGGENCDHYELQLYRDSIALSSDKAISVSGVTTYDFHDMVTSDGSYSYTVTSVNGDLKSDTVSSNTVVRDTTAPKISNEFCQRISADSVNVRFTVSEATSKNVTIYLYVSSSSTAPSVDEVKNKGKHDAIPANEPKAMTINGLQGNGVQYVYVVATDDKGNTSEPYSIMVPAFTEVTPTPTAAPTTAPTPTPVVTYTVTLNGGTGYSVVAANGSSSPVNAGGSFSFTVNIANGYTKGSAFTVKANDATLSSYNGVYTISNINANQNVTVTGVVVAQTGGGGYSSVAPIPSITTTILPSASLGEEYNFQLTATGGTPITWSYTGNLPAGITISSLGLISGTPTAEGTFRFTLKASNSTGSANRQMTLVVTGEGYSVTQGANAEWVSGSKTGLTFISNGKTKFSVRIDGSTVPEKELTFASDNSSVTVSSAYLDTLSTGSHTLTMVYSDGNAKTKFTIKSKGSTVAPDITGQPQSAQVDEGDTVTFTVTSSGSKPLQCQWQMDANDGKGWTDISGASGVSYSVKSATAEQNGWKYRCVVTNAAGSVESNAATLTIRGAAEAVPGDEADEEGSGFSIGKIILPIVLVVVLAGVGGGLYYYFRRKKLMDEDE